MITLYIKTHNITGLKYFGKTTKEDIEKYTGSGLYWTRHIKKHDYDVTTEIYAQFEDECDELIVCALKFSKDNNIVESKEWANMKVENGKDGNPKDIVFSDLHRENLSKAQTGNKLSDENKEKLKGRIPWNKGTKGHKYKLYVEHTCPYCNLKGRGGTMFRWHFDNCKMNGTQNMRVIK